jgi:hypothetical protein
MVNATEPEVVPLVSEPKEEAPADENTHADPFQFRNPVEREGSGEPFSPLTVVDPPVDVLDASPVS